MPENEVIAVWGVTKSNWVCLPSPRGRGSSVLSPVPHLSHTSAAMGSACGGTSTCGGIFHFPTSL